MSENKRSPVPTLEIERGIPIPHQTARLQWPFHKMEIGDSLFFATKPELRRAVGAAAARKKAYPEFNFTSRPVEGGFRLWRVAPKEADEPNEPET